MKLGKLQNILLLLMIFTFQYCGGVLDISKLKIIHDSNNSLNDSVIVQLEKRNIIDSTLTFLNKQKNTSKTNSRAKERALIKIIHLMHTKYEYGGKDENGIDCSAFTQSIFEYGLNISLSRSALSQFGEGEPINDIKELKFGDLVFFDTAQRTNPGHVGFYVGKNKFAHASSSRGVMISSFNSNYWRQRFLGGRRIPEAIRIFNN